MIALTSERLAELRAIAQAATPGPWFATRHTEVPSVYAKPEHESLSYGIAQMTTITLQGAAQSPGPANAAHIVAFNPVGALALLDRIASLEAAIREIRTISFQCAGTSVTDGPMLSAINERLRVALNPEPPKP